MTGTARMAALAALCMTVMTAGAALAADPKENPMERQVLLIIDIQNDYFPGGAFEQEGAEAAAARAREAMDHFRAKGWPVIHVRHESVRPGATFFLPGTKGSQIHQSVKPLDGEKVVLKHYPNSFRETPLKMILDELGVRRVVVAGMMTLMCVDATSRAAADLGYGVTVLSDTCAARALVFEGASIPASQVHGAFLAALGMGYAEVVPTGEFIARPNP